MPTYLACDRRTSLSSLNPPIVGYHKIPSRTFTIIIIVYDIGSLWINSIERDSKISNYGKDLCGDASQICLR